MTLPSGRKVCVGGWWVGGWVVVVYKVSLVLALVQNKSLSFKFGLDLDQAEQ
jgi:hypothetical protein